MISVEYSRFLFIIDLVLLVKNNIIQFWGIKMLSLYYGEFWNSHRIFQVVRALQERM